MHHAFSGVVCRFARAARLLGLSVAALGTLGLTAPVLEAQARPQPTARTDTAARADSVRVDSLARIRRSTTLQSVNVTAERARAAPPPVARIDVDTAILVSTPAANAYDLVRRAAGLEVHEQGQGPGFTSNAVIRGFNSDHSADVLLVVDGVPINAPVHGHVEGFADWNVLFPGVVNSMRVIHGTASPLYGDFSLAGVVEVFTAADAQGTRGAVSTSSFGDVGVWMKTGARADRGGWLAATDVRRNQGWQPNSAYLLGNALVRGWRAIGAGRLEGGAQLYRSGWDSPGFVSVARYNTRDLRAVVDSTDGGRSSRLMLSARYSRPLPPLRSRPLALELTAWAQGSAQEMFLNIPGEGNITRQSGENDDRRGAGGQAQLVWLVPLGELVAGTSFRGDRATYTLENTLARQASSIEHSYDARFWSSGSYVRWRRLVGGRLALDVGARFDVLHHESEDRLANTAWREATTSVASPKLGARYLLPWSIGGAGVSLLASSSHGFRSPPGVIAEPGRAPYLAWSHETGLALERDAFSAHASLFRIDTRNERIFNPVTLGVSSAGRSRRQGVDARMAWRIPTALAQQVGLSSFTLDGAVTLNDARFLGVAPSDTARVSDPNAGHDHNVPIFPGDPVPGVARYTARISADIDVDVSWLRHVRVSYRILGPFTPIAEPGVITRVASVFDLGASVPLRAMGASLDLDVQNVLDLRYVENRASQFITPGVPCVLRASLRFPQ
jgi:hypothetical protein